MTLTAGHVLQNRYRFASSLGQGGMGTIYRAWHLNLNLPVAIKEMTPQSGLDAQMLAQLRQQFQREAAILARLDHSHLVGVMDFFEESGNSYLVMHFVEGESLADKIERGRPLSEDRVLTRAGQLLDALAYCHSQGVIHRDVKPHNVIVRPDGRAVLVDFGLVKLWDPSDLRTRTAMRGMGTPEYAPPEQYDADHGHTDPRSDIYSLGATLYHALTGTSPPTATQRMVDPTSLKPLRVLNPQLSTRVEQATLKAVEPQPSQRFQSAWEMAAALSGEPSGSAHLAPAKRARTKLMPRATPVASPQVRRVPTWTWIAGGAAISLLLVGLVFGRGVMKGPVPMSTGLSTATPSSMSTATSKAMPTQAATATPTPVPTVQPTPSLFNTGVRSTDNMVMVYVPSGTFQMGSDDGHADERPVHTVEVDGFWIDQTEVTNAQYVRCVAEGECQRSLFADDVEFNGDDYPVVGVTWYSAKAYCEWAGVRLLTEAEWEYAARGLAGHIHPWGNSPRDCGKVNYGSCEGGTSAVGSYPTGSSWCGAMDMAGNVQEWVEDWMGIIPLRHR